MELLKQGQYKPWPVEQQIVLIYAATQNRPGQKVSWIRKYAKAEVPRYAKELIDFMKSKHSGLLDDIRNNPKQKIDPVKDRLEKALAEFEGVFQGKTVEV